MTLPALGNTIPAPATDVNLNRCRRVHSCLLSAAATWHFLTPFPHSTTDLSHGWSGGGGNWPPVLPPWCGL